MLKSGKWGLTAGIAAAAVALSLMTGCSGHGAGTAFALEGDISSAAEGAMEGVVVSAKRDGSTITTSVVSDAKGHFAFPADRMAPGHYALVIRAVGYDLASTASADVAQGQTATAKLQLVPTKNLAAQLSSAEWLLSIPGTETQKAALTNCSECHTLQRPMMSSYDANGFKQIIDRMLGTYTYQSQPETPQLLLHPRPVDPARRDEMARYLSTLNLSQGPNRRYPLKTLPRVKGEGTRVIITEYALPRPLSQPHDAVVDRDGNVWYADFGEQKLGRLDPKTGAVKEFDIPVVHPEAPKGVLGVEAGADGRIWIGMHMQAAIGVFDPKTEKFRVYALPDDVRQPNSQDSQLTTLNQSVNGKIWTTMSADTAVRIDVASGKFEYFRPFANLPKVPAGPSHAVSGGEMSGGDGKTEASSMIPAPHVLYGVISDSHNNVYGLDFIGRSVFKIDAKTGAVTEYPTAIPFSQPRRGAMDAKDRLWFAEYNANRVAMLDTKTGKMSEWALPTPWSAPYDAMADKNGYVWTAGMNTDRVVRLDPRTGKAVEYQLPRTTNVRRVFVDNSGPKPVFWVGSNHGASIIKVEPLD